MLKEILGCTLTYGMLALPGLSSASAADRSGEQVFRDTCALCHTTGVSPDLAGQSLSDETVLVMVRNGSNAMPAFRASEISDGELKNLAKFLAGLKPGGAKQ
jgi:mono/diheme cytochrome c family protein